MYKNATLISVQFSYKPFCIVFYSAMKYLSACNLTCFYIHLVKNHRHRSVTNSNKPMALISILNLLFCPRLILLFVSMWSTGKSYFSGATNVQFGQLISPALINNSNHKQFH